MCRDRAEGATEDLEPGLDARKEPGHESWNLNQYVSNFSVTQMPPFRREVGSEPENGAYSIWRESVCNIIAMSDTAVHNQTQPVQIDNEVEKVYSQCNGNFPHCRHWVLDA